jgi:SAM-dependent methyltransferase
MIRYRTAWLPAALAALLALPVAVLFSCGAFERVEAAGQNGDQAAGNAADSPKRPLQIGKLVKKRQIAPVMNVAHADWLTRPERDAEEQPDRVVAELQIPKGATVVDLGAGVGYFTWRLANQVGPHGHVIAVDIQPGMLDLLQQNLKDRGITNVETVLGAPEDPHLPVGKVDLVLIVDVYHELQHPEKTMEHVRRSLKPDGRVVLIEYRREDPNIPINPLHKMSVEEVRGELEPMGFRLVKLMDFLPTQHIFVFQDALGARR